MGWASGSDLYDSVIKVLVRYVPDVDKRIQAHKELIRAFEGGDWDTQDECTGQDDAYDKALEELHEWEDED
jgi:hypothetical protein